MNKKTRLIILLACVACFLIVAPILVAYSMGYRFDFEKIKITATGGIYIRTFPAAEQIIIDSKLLEKPGLFSNSIFVQSLLPKNHTVSIKKNSYYDYFKTLTVAENQVTKLENVILFKKNIKIESAPEKTQSPFLAQTKYIIKNSDLYYSPASENTGLTLLQKSTPIIKKLTAFAIQNNNILWLGTDGLLYSSDPTNPTALPTKLTTVALKISSKSTYKIISDNQNVFVNAGGNLLFLNTKTSNLDNFSTGVKDAKISFDGQNLVYFDNSNIYISPIPPVALVGQKTLYKSSGKINDCIWLNNDYIVFTDGDKIIISETDYRGNINSITLPQKADQIFFNQQSGKLYILTGKTLLVSEKITP
jgi:hypothetical protein